MQITIFLNINNIVVQLNFFLGYCKILVKKCVIYMCETKTIYL